MYLNEVFVENNGPLRSFHLQLSFDQEGKPTPTVLVGINGSGKTNLLSLVADALYESASAHFTDLTTTNGNIRSWFRVAGGKTTTVNTSGGYSILRFVHEGNDLYFREKTGIVEAADAKSRLPPALAPQADWPTDGAIKDVSISPDLARGIFDQGVYTYFPSSRAEVPHWLNRSAIIEPEFDTQPGLNRVLRKPIFVERSLDSVKQWLLGVVMDARADFEYHWDAETKTAVPRLLGSVMNNLMGQGTLNLCNVIIRKVLQDDTYRLVWLGRGNPDKLSIMSDNALVVRALDGLSSGQSILLSMFCTILKYGEGSNPGIATNEITGICLIDEIDAHVHIDLQNKVLPELIRLFPKVQFIITSHSPLFVLGMQDVFGIDGLRIINMPDGETIDASAYGEFKKALSVFERTQAFHEKLREAMKATGAPIVYLEGQTDPDYLRRACQLLGRTDLLQKCEFVWIGTLNEHEQAVFTGKDAFRQAFAFIKANMSLFQRHMLLLHDNDDKAENFDSDVVSVRTLPLNKENKRIEAGIENFLTEDCFAEKFWKSYTVKKPNGKTTVTTELRKVELCEHLCANGTAEQFFGFAKALEVVDEFLTKF